MQSFKTLLFLLIVVCALIIIPRISPVSATPPAGFINEKLIIGLQQPVDLEFTPDGRMFILERGGKVKIVQPGATTVDSTPLLTLPGGGLSGEGGAFGITLDPQFATNGYFYIFYTRSNPQRDGVSRFQAVGNTANLSSEFLVWVDNVDVGEWHHGGSIAFDSAGKMYISTGDHHDTDFTSNHVSQRLDSYRGKILRINKDGTIPTDNPFFDGPEGPNLDEIWVRGLRNPFRITIDQVTDKLYIADVGGNVDESIEEVNIGVAGANYGWPLCEGNCGLPGITSPAFSYPHVNGRDASITGGFVYRGTTFPQEYRGSYFYGDYAQNWIRRLTLDGSGNPTGSINFEPADGAVDGPYGDIVSMKMGPDGNLYYAHIGIAWLGTPSEPAIRRIKYISGNQPPVIASASADVTSGPGPTLYVQFSASASDPENADLTYNWDFGDNTATSSAQSPTHTYETKGAYTARLTVSDGVNETLSNPILIEVGNKPTAIIVTGAGSSTFQAGEEISVVGEGQDPDETLGESNYSWEIVFNHEEHNHPALGPVSGSSVTFTIPTSGHSYEGNTSYQIILTVTDSDGLSDTSDIKIFPEKVNLTLASNPTGAELSVDQAKKKTPFVIDELIGFHTTVNAFSQQILSNKVYNFSSWSDGGAAQHEITIPATNQTLTANYVLATSSPNGSLYFDGTNDFVKSANFPLNTVFTVEAWFKRVSANGKDQVIVSDANVFYTQAMYTLLVDGGGTNCPRDGEIAFHRFHQGGNAQQCSGVIAELNRWYHVAVTRDSSGSQKIYVDGVLKNTAQTPAPKDSTGIMTIGRAGNALAAYFSGYIDEVRISSSVVYTGSFTPSTTSLISSSTTQALWHFNEGSGQIASDSSSFHRNGFLGTNNNNSDNADPLWLLESPVAAN